MSNLSNQTHDAARAVFRVTEQCLLANKAVEGITDSDPERRQSEKANYEHHLVEAIASALAIKDQFYKCVAIRQVINVCRNANDLDIAKTLFKEVDHNSLREQIVKDVPALAGDGKKIANEENTAIIHLDGLNRDEIIHLVTKSMRDSGASERARSTALKTTPARPTTTQCWPRQSAGERRCTF